MKKYTAEDFEEFHKLLMADEITIDDLEKQMDQESMQDFLTWMEKENAKEPRFQAILKLADIEDGLSVKQKKEIVYEALKLYPNLIEAYIELFLLEKGYYRRLAFIDKAIKIGEEILNKYDLENENLYEIYEIRAYIIALDVKANFLIENDVLEEGIAIYEKIIELDPSDHLAIRFRLIPLYITENNDLEAANLYDIYMLDESMEMYYHKALIEFRKGDLAEAEKYLEKGIKKNKHIIKAICHDREYSKMIKTISDDFSEGSLKEAQEYLELSRLAWRKSLKAIEWLLEMQDKKKEIH